MAHRSRSIAKEDLGGGIESVLWAEEHVLWPIEHFLWAMDHFVCNMENDVGPVEHVLRAMEQILWAVGYLPGPIEVVSFDERPPCLRSHRSSSLRNHG